MSTPLPLCPTCQALLKKMPSRKTKCPACGNYMYMKRAPHETEKRLVSEAEAARIEQQWRDRASEQEFFNMGWCHGVKKHEYDAKILELKPKVDSDYLHWSAAWELIHEWLVIEKELHKRKSLYFYLAQLARSKGRDHRSYIRQSHRCDLKFHEARFKSIRKIPEIVISTPDHACETCQSNCGKSFTFEEALDLEPLPCKGCTCGSDGYCICYYQYYWDYESPRLEIDE